MNETNRCIFHGMSILFQNQWLTDHAVIVENNKIKAIINADMIKHHLPAKQYKFSADYHLLPGFIDLHIHGIQGCDVMDATKEGLATISQALAAQGVTGFLATTMTAENDRIEAVLKLMPEMMAYQDGAALLGVHLEGPFISKEKIGAQCANFTQTPNATLVDHWQKMSKGAIKLVTLAPELPGALELVKALHNMNIVASIGHTEANYADTRAAIVGGCKHATHLFNAMRGLHQREPGAVTALLLADDVIAEVIVDGVHLHPAIVDLALQMKGRQRLALVTDAMRATCLGNGQYELGGQMVNVQDNKATLADGTLAGSTLTMPQAIKNMVEFTHCSLIDAIDMAALTPASALKVNEHKGSIEIGKDADLVVMQADFKIVLTMREGKVVFEV